MASAHAVHHSHQQGLLFQAFHKVAIFVDLAYQTKVGQGRNFHVRADVHDHPRATMGDGLISLAVKQTRLVATGTKGDFLRLLVPMPRPEVACQKR